MTIAAIILLVLTVLCILVVLLTLKPDVKDRPHQALPVFFMFSCASAVLLVLTLVAGWLAIAPEYRLHKASIEKRILVEQAKGTAEANKIVDTSITEPYLRYLYINSLKNTENQVIYLPTEAGLPILEAGRQAK